MRFLILAVVAAMALAASSSASSAEPSGLVARSGALRPCPRGAVDGEHGQRPLRRHAVFGPDVDADEGTRRAGVPAPGRSVVPVHGLAERTAPPGLAPLAARWAQLALVGCGRRRVRGDVRRQSLGRPRGTHADSGGLCVKAAAEVVRLGIRSPAGRVRLDVLVEPEHVARVVVVLERDQAVEGVAAV